MLPALSSELAVKICCPSVNGPTCNCHLPSTVAVVCPASCPSLNTRTVVPASALPWMVGVAFLVILSLLLAPVSLAVVSFKLVGALGATVSMTTCNGLDAVLTFPAISVELAVRL